MKKVYNKLLFCRYFLYLCTAVDIDGVLKTYKIMKPNLFVSLNDLRKIVDSCFNDSLLVPVLTPFDRSQISQLKDFILPNLVDYCQNFGEIHSLTPVSVYRHNLPTINGEIQDLAVAMFRLTRKRKYYSYKPLYFVLFMSDFKIYRTLNLSLSNASQLYTLYIDGLRIKSRDISPELPF